MNQPNNSHTSTNPVGRFMVAVGAIIQQSQTGKILLIQRAPELDWQPNQWEALYGRIDQSEGPEQGLRREVSEEVGITQLEINQVLTVWHMYRGLVAPENELIGITYAASTEQESIRLSDEHSQYRWVTPEEALEIVTIEGIKRDIRAFMVRTE